MKFKVIYFGSWGYGRAGLEGLLNHPKIDVLKIYTKFDLNSLDTYINQVYSLAQENGVKVINTRRDIMTSKEFVDEVTKNKSMDYLVSCCYDRFFPASILKYPKILALNVHPSLLPKYLLK